MNYGIYYEKLLFLITEYLNSRAAANLTVPGEQDFHFPHFSSNFDKFYFFFPQNILILFLILALWVGESLTREGSGYATVELSHCIYLSCI